MVTKTIHSKAIYIKQCLMKYPSPPLLCRPQYMYVHVGGPGDTAVAHERACEPFQSVPTAWRWRCHPSPSRRCQERTVTLDPVRVHLPHQAMHHRTTLRSNRRERHASFAPLTPRGKRELCNDRACIAGCLGRTCGRIHPKDCAKRPHRPGAGTFLSGMALARLCRWGWLVLGVLALARVSCYVFRH